MNIKPGMEFSPEKLREPDSEFAVTYMWFWNVPVTKELLDRELQKYAKAGVRSLYIVPLPKDFRPEELRTYLDPEYLSEEFFELVRFALRRATELGMTPWLYDEGGWPSGGACGKTHREDPSSRLDKIVQREISLSCDERFHPDGRFVALFEGKRRLPDDYIASRDVTLTAYYLEDDTRDGNRIDGTSETANDTFIKNTYERYKNELGDLFSKTPIFFTDEPGLFRATPAKGIFDKFIIEYGYDLRDFLYVIEDGGVLATTEKEIQARIDWAQLTGKLFLENTFDKLYRWCNENGIYYGGHLDCDNRPWGGVAKGCFSLLSGLRRFHVPGIDVIWEQIRYPYDGRDPLDEETLGFGFFPRLASSAARQIGNNVCLTEALGIYGDGLTHDEIRYIINYQMIRGINAINFAPISLGVSRMAALMTRPNFRPEKPGFYNMKEIHEYYARLSYLTRLGYAEGDTALYMPCRDLAADPTTLDQASAAFKAMGTELEKSCIPFDIIDDEGIRLAADTGEGLKLGDAIYRHIYAPKCKYMPDDVKSKIEPYIDEGEPSYKFKSENLRIMTRKLNNSRLVFIFNEAVDTVSEEFDFGETRIYRIDPRNGLMYREKKASATLVCGDIAVFLLTDAEYECSSEDAEYSVETSELTPVGYRRFVIEYNGLKNEYGEGEPPLAKDFSGEITYRCSYQLPSKPKSGEIYRICLSGFGVSASVRLGERDIPFGLSPMQATVNGSELSQSGEMLVTVANTAVNEIIAKRDVMYSHPTAEIGVPYRKKLEEFERPSKIRLGNIKIEKLTVKG